MPKNKMMREQLAKMRDVNVYKKITEGPAVQKHDPNKGLTAD
jgi:hypothetical protein